MTKYREIIRLTGLGFSQRDIMASCGVAQKTVVKVQKRARELNISWPLYEAMTDTELQRLMFSKENKVSPNKRMPDYAYIPDSRINMTRLVPPLRVLHISPACLTSISPILSE